MDDKPDRREEGGRAGLGMWGWGVCGSGYGAGRVGLGVWGLARAERLTGWSALDRKDDGRDRRNASCEFGRLIGLDGMIAAGRLVRTPSTLPGPGAGKPPHQMHCACKRDHCVVRSG